jgi:hypothetical protein
MKKQADVAIRARIIRGAFYLLMVAACTIPFALAQRNTSANTTHVPAGSSAGGGGTAAVPIRELPTGFPLWDQYDNPATEPPINIGSQDFEPAFDTLDDQAADDFVLPDPGPGFGVFVTGVRIMGEYSDGAGPASSFNVYFYSNGADNLPGNLIATFLNLAYTGTPLTLRSLCPTPSPLAPEPFRSRCRLGKISIQTVSGFGITGPSNQTPVPPGRIRATATAPAASRGTEKTCVCPTRYRRPIKFSRSSASRRAIRLHLHPQLQRIAR